MRAGRERFVWEIHIGYRRALGACFGAAGVRCASVQMCCLVSAEPQAEAVTEGEPRVDCAVRACVASCKSRSRTRGYVFCACVARRRACPCELCPRPPGGLANVG